MKKLLLFCVLIGLVACDGGLSPMEEVDPIGQIIVNISYSGDWPDSEDLHDLRFIAFRFMPQTPSDFTRITEMVISPRLEYFVDEQTVTLQNVRNGVFYYNAIGWQYGDDIFQDWRPAGIYTENDGMFEISGNTVEIHVSVDFDDLPVFPPEDIQ